MKLELEKLIELQNTDTNIRKLKKSIETANERRASIEQEFEQHAFEIHEIQSRKENAKTEKADLERQIAEIKTHLERANRNLKNAQDQKQYETAMRDADVSQKKIAAFEVEILEKDSVIEEVDGVLNERAEEISNLQGDKDKALADFADELKNSETELAVKPKKEPNFLPDYLRTWQVFTTG